MTERPYDAADITVVAFDEHVRRCPGMYFGVGPSSPDLATRVMTVVLDHALHPPARIAPVHSLRIRAEIHGDLVFTVSDDLAEALDEHGLPRPGYFGSLLGADRWAVAVAAAVSSRTVVEVWRDGRGFRQELAGIQPAGEPREFAAPAGAGTRVHLELDETYFAPGTAITADLASPALHAPDCDGPGGPGRLTLRDLR